ncbi:MAG: 4Fe-4S dicluster domain-containing protein, partial [Hyphomicrobiales bacterium]|nr:4Fe-4S dicluster domain-containing protein [Hyphomicrobiales bacterium]
VGLLHVRPVLNLRQDLGAKTMRAIAEEAFDMVAAYKGSHSGEHGDGIVRSEFHERMFGSRMVRAFEQVKDRLDPDGVLNPGKIVRAPKMDDRSLFRWPPDYQQIQPDTVFDWSAWPNGLVGATEMCNNNGACRKSAGAVMCPSYRATRNERDVTRGRANSLRLALTGRLGEAAMASDEMAETMKLCVSCKACKTECPMSVDMAMMKIEVEAARIARQGMTLHQRLVAHLPRYAPLAGRLRALANVSALLPGAVKRLFGFSASRQLPRFANPFLPSQVSMEDADVLLFADTFNRHFEPEALAAATRVIERSGKRVAVATADGGNLCCGRTYLSNGMPDRAVAEMRRTAEVFIAALNAGKTVVGLEPSCVLTFRDEAVNLLPEWNDDLGSRVLTFAEYVQQQPSLQVAQDAGQALVHGHCHQKAFGTASATCEILSSHAGLSAEMVESSCCGMAGSFGYQKDTDAVSREMAELSLAPAVRAASDDTQIVADGFSCRCQIRDTTGRKAEHSAVVIDRALGGSE